MRIPGSTLIKDSRPTVAADLGKCALWAGWQCIRLPLLLFLLVLEPIVTLVLGPLALLGVLTALFWKFFGPPSLGGRVVASSQISAHRQPPTRRPRSTTSTLSLSLAARTGARPPARLDPNDDVVKILRHARPCWNRTARQEGRGGAHLRVDVDGICRGPNAASTPFPRACRCNRTTH